MSRLFRRSAILSVFLLGISGALYPCGGPDSYPIEAPLLPARQYLENLLQADYETGQRRPEVRFLYPIRVTRPGEMETLWDLTYGSDSGWTPGARIHPTTTDSARERLAEAIAGGDRTTAAREANAIVDQVLDMPADQADSNQPALRLAVEYLELRDTLSHLPPGEVEPTLETIRAEIQPLARREMGTFAEQHPTHPRAPSLRFVAIQEAMKTGIPNGWRDEIAKQMSPADWARLEQIQNQWLQDYPTHPLADLVRLSRLRVDYLKGDDRAAWDLLVKLYPRHPARVLTEMRFLIMQGVSEGVDSLALHSDLDPALRTALLGELPWSRVSPADWTAMWRLSIEHGNESWAVSLQERLLQKAAEGADSMLPEGFPSHPANPTDRLGKVTLWGYFRALALVRAGKIDEALEQTRLAGMPKEVAPLRVQLYLRRRQWTKALSDPDLEPHARQYLIWVMAPDSVLGTLGVGSAEIAKQARLAMAVHAARREGWLAGARLLQPADSSRAVLWRRAAALAADSSLAGRLAYARFLHDKTGQLYFDLSQSHTWYRSLEYRRSAMGQPAAASGLPWGPDQERAAIERHLVENSALYDALHAYADYLDRAPVTSRDFSSVLREADTLYNLLLNWSHWDSGFWFDYIRTCPEAEAVRRAGKRARAARYPPS